MSPFEADCYVEGLDASLEACVAEQDEPIHRCIRCNTNYTATAPCKCGANASLRDNRNAS